jgi:alpha-mannosidase
MDHGIQRFRYTLLPHTGSWENAGTPRSAAELNQPPVALFATFHPEGRLPQAASFLSVDPSNVMVTVLKDAEDGDGLILRAYETCGAAAQACIKLPALGRTIEADFGPAEIKTFHIPGDASQPVTERNMLEWLDD